jgi:hypothetical protein
MEDIQCYLMSRIRTDSWNFIADICTSFKRKVYWLANSYFPSFQMRSIAKINVYDRMESKMREYSKFECEWVCKRNLWSSDSCRLLSIAIMLLFYISTHTNAQSQCLSVHEVTIRLTFLLNNVYSEPFLIAVGVWCVGLQLFACWDCGFESCRGDGCLLWMCVVM